MKSFRLLRVFVSWRLGLWLGPVLVIAGCNGLHEPPPSEQFYEVPGLYPAAPLGAVRPRVGVPAPAVELIAGTDAPEHGTAAASDELMLVTTQSGRFNPVGRKRLSEMISLQGSDGMLSPGTLDRQAAIQGIDFVLLCSIQKLSITRAGSENMLRIGKPMITTSCIISLSLVDPSNGSVAASVRDDFNRTASPQAMGLRFDSPDAGEGNLRLTDEQLHHVMRIVLDDAMRKLLPDADRALAHFKQAVIVTAPQTQPAIGGVVTPPASQPLPNILCPECGFSCSAYDEFCPNCGNRMPPRTTGFQPFETTKPSIK